MYEGISPVCTRPDVAAVYSTLGSIICVFLLTGCGDNPVQTPAEQREQILQLAGAGNIDAAMQSVGELMRSNPDDPETLRVYGHVMVKAGRGAVAEGVFLRAETLGLERSRFRLDLARALMLQQKYREAVRVLETADADFKAGIEWQALLAEAELQIPYLDQQRVFEIFLRLYKTLANGGTDTGRKKEISDWLAAERQRHAVVEKAYQHFSCAGQPVAEIESNDADRAGNNSGGTILRVGPTRRLKAPSDAAREARDGDIIEIDAGTYENDVAVWPQNNLVLRGVGGMAHLKSDGVTAEDKGIWLFEGNDNTVEYIEFSGARSKYKNGSGIRLHGEGLTVRHSYFHDNEDGILGGYGEDSRVLVEFSEFARNGYGDGQSHNIYIGQIGSFTLRYSYSHHARVGHLVKSRARTNHILYNRIMDESTGNSSYVIDISEGGRAYIIGNELHKGPGSENPMVISFGAERQDRPDQALYVVHNTFHNQNPRSIYVKNYTDAEALLLNNLFAGAPGVLLQGAGRAEGFVRGGFLGLADPQAYDYALTADSPAVDAGIPIAETGAMNLAPVTEYVHKMRARPRLAVWKPDIGAHEFCGY